MYPLVAMFDPDRYEQITLKGGPSCTMTLAWFSGKSWMFPCRDRQASTFSEEEPGFLHHLRQAPSAKSPLTPHGVRMHVEAVRLYVLRTVVCMLAIITMARPA